MRASIHILTKDRPSELAICLSSLLRQTNQDWDLVLIDESETPILNYKFVKDILQQIKLEKHGLIYKRNWPPRNNVGVSRNEAVEIDYYNNPIGIRIDDDSWVDQDYIKKLVNLYKLKRKEEKIGAIGGIVPLMGYPKFIKDSNRIEIFNEIKFDKGGNIIKIADDGGCHWLPYKILPSHHLRSSFLYNIKAYKEVGGCPSWCANTGWREETIFCMKLAWAGYKMYTDTSARAWHCPGRSGGARIDNNIRIKLQNNIEHCFRNWAKRMYLKYGNPFIKNKTEVKHET